MRIIHELDEMTETARGWLVGGPVGLVPIIGNLHAGHVALIQCSLQECELTVVSFFDNLLQVGADETRLRDIRDRDVDFQLLDKEHVDVIFIPPKQNFYPIGFSTGVIPSGPIAEKFEGATQSENIHRFATAMMKIFQLVRPDIVYLGQKKAQQAALIRKLVHDLNIDLNVRLLPIIRENDGVAVGSRIRLLSVVERHAVAILYRSLLAGKAVIETGERLCAVIEKVVTDLIATEPLLKLDYVAICDPYTFEEIGNTLGENLPDVLIVVAVHVGDIHLVDNILWKSSNY